MAKRKVGRNTYSLLSSVLPTVNLTVFSHLKNPVCKGEPLVTQSSQGIVEKAVGNMWDHQPDGFSK